MNLPELPAGWSYQERGEEVRAYNDQPGGLTFWNRGPDNYQEHKNALSVTTIRGMALGCHLKYLHFW